MAPGGHSLHLAIFSVLLDNSETSWTDISVTKKRLVGTEEFVGLPAWSIAFTIFCSSGISGL